MCFKKKYDSTLMPSSSTNCFEKKCVNFYVNKVIHLRPYEVAEIDLELLVDCPHGFVCEIINHFNNNPWQVIDRVIYQKDEKTSLRVNIISSSFYTLNRGDILCHAQIQSVKEIYDILKST
jgi:hypothetical protein